MEKVSRVRYVVQYHLGKFNTQIQVLRGGKRIGWDIGVVEMKLVKNIRKLINY